MKTNFFFETHTIYYNYFKIKTQQKNKKNLTRALFVLVNIFLLLCSKRVNYTDIELQNEHKTQHIYKINPIYYVFITGRAFFVFFFCCFGCVAHNNNIPTFVVEIYLKQSLVIRALLQYQYMGVELIVNYCSIQVKNNTENS